MSKSVKFSNNTYLDSTSIVHKKETLPNILNSNTFNYNDWETSQEITSSSQTTIKGMSTTIKTRGRALLVSFTVPLYHNGGTCFIKIVVDNVTKYTYGYSLNTNTVCSYTTVINNLSAGSHTVRIDISKNNTSSVKVLNYTSRNFTVAEI